MALEKIWHIEHFVCAYCKRQLGTDIFYESDGFPYCELDYQELFLPKCADCHAAIFDVSVSTIVYGAINCAMFNWHYDLCQIFWLISFVLTFFTGIQLWLVVI